MNSLLKPFSLRIIALLCALLLWFYVTMEKRYETTLNIPIRMANVPPALTPAGDFPAVAKVLVSATGKRLLMLRYSHVELYVNCSEVRPGPNTLTLARGSSTWTMGAMGTLYDIRQTYLPAFPPWVSRMACTS